MKGKDTRGYSYQGYLPAAIWNWLRVNFDDGEKLEYPEKNPSKESDW